MPPDKVKKGKQSNNWNPNREEVARNEAARRSAYALLWGTLRRINSAKLSSSAELLGYTAKELAVHLEAQFQPGMSWANRRAWHIDHIKPVSAFVSEGITDVRVINALNNLRPIWARENLMKRASWTAH